MHLIKNYEKLNKTPERKIILDLIETALQSIKPQNVLSKSFTLQSSILTIKNEHIDLSKFDNIYLIGFGKGSAGISKIIEKTLGRFLTEGYVIDIVDERFTKIKYTKGTHPLPSQTNIDFTKIVLDKTKNLTANDLILVVICGGGSALFEYPHNLTLKELNDINISLINSGATISEINTIRKHLSAVKGGRLAKHLFPSVVRSLIFSDVPGNEISTIASGPTTFDMSTVDDAKKIIQKYNLSISQNLFSPPVENQKYFQNIFNILMLSNLTALNAMKSYAKGLGLKARIYSDKLQGNSKTIGQKLISETRAGEILLVGGETTLNVKGPGHGGRNQSAVVAALPYLGEDTTFAAFDSDGIDFYRFAGAIADGFTIKQTKEKSLDPKSFLDKDNTYEFLTKVGDGILTGKLNSNVSDLMIILKK